MFLPVMSVRPSFKLAAQNSTGNPNTLRGAPLQPSVRLPVTAANQRRGADQLRRRRSRWLQEGEQCSSGDEELPASWTVFSVWSLLFDSLKPAAPAWRERELGLSPHPSRPTTFSQPQPSLLQSPVSREPMAFKHSWAAIPLSTKALPLQQVQLRLSGRTGRKKAAGWLSPVFEPSGPVPAAAFSSSPSQSLAEVVEQGGAAPLSSLQFKLIQNMINETVEECRFVWPSPSLNVDTENVQLWSRDLF